MNINFKERIAQVLQLDDYSLISEISDISMGDYALPCFKLASEHKKNPIQFAEELKQKLDSSNFEWLDRVESVKGYLNFFINRQYFIKNAFLSLQEKGEEFSNLKSNNKTVTIDYSSINIAKDFHIGHLMSTAIGGSLYRIFKYLGYNVVGINYLGDYGTQFGKLIAGYKRWGQGMESNMENLSLLYTRANKEALEDKEFEQEARYYFKKIEENDEEALNLFRLFKEITLEEVDKIYCLLGISFDCKDGESYYNDKMQPVVDLLKEKGLLKESDGAMVVDLEKYNMTPCLILKSDGASLYATRDLAAAIDRKNRFSFDENLYIVAYQQNLHFKQVFKVLELLGFDWANQCKHIPFGMVSIEGGGSLSSRKGNVIKLKDVLKTAIDKTYSIINEKNPLLKDKEKISEYVGVGAVIFNALSTSRIKDVVFSFDKALSFEGETGPYIQYTYARCCSVLNKSQIDSDDDSDNKKNNNNIAFSYLTDDTSYEVIRYLSRFDDIVRESARVYEPSVIARYLINLSKSYNKFYLENRILVEDEQIRLCRILLTRYTRNVLKNGLGLILMNAPENM